jgi:hypothetical protein
MLLLLCFNDLGTDVQELNNIEFEKQAYLNPGGTSLNSFQGTYTYKGISV